MKRFIFLLLLTSCQAIPQLYQTAEDIADDDAVKIVISREAIQQKTDIKTFVDIKNP